MSEIVAIVEGQTEQAFVQNQLAAHMGNLGISIWSVMSGKTRKRGGVRKWESARNDIIRTLKGGRYCTTMFDFYGMPEDWPGRSDAKTLPWVERGAHVEAEILKDITGALGSSFDPAQFIPYIQIHEFEALVFSDPNELAGVVAAHSALPEAALASRFEEILEQNDNPEAIDDGYETCPSRRITQIVAGYRKRLHGPIITNRIGLEQIRLRCRHFAEWVEKLEQLAIRHE